MQKTDASYHKASATN